MPNTYSQIYVHFVFAVEWRKCLIPLEHKDEFYKYITGVIKGQGQKLMAINGMPDHLHILAGFSPEIAPSDFVKKVKGASSRFFNDKQWASRQFNWQRGYGGFSCSRSDVPRVAARIEDQEGYHVTHSFKEEYLELLDSHGIDYDPKYLFDFMDDAQIPR